MTTMLNKAADLARKLTESQINALHFPSGYHDPNTIKALRRKGLWSGALLTPLGVEVRSIIIAEQEA